MVPDWLRREFRLRNVFFEHNNERVLYGCQWKWPPLLYIAVRAFLSVYSAYALLHHLIDSGHTRETSIVYFSAWSYLLLVLHLITSAALSFYFHRYDDEGIVHLELPSSRTNAVAETLKRQHARATEIPKNHSQEGLASKNDGTSEAMVEADFENNQASTDHVKQASEQSEESAGFDAALVESTEEQDRSARLQELQDLHSTYESFSNFHRESIEADGTRWYLQASWCLSNVASASAPVASVLYFSDLYPRSESKLDMPNLNVQILNIIFVLIDHMISARPIRLLHAVMPIVFGLIYIIFSLIYWSTDKLKPVIYDVILDWTNPGVPVGFIFGLSLIVFPAIQVIFFGIHHAKKRLHLKLYDTPFDEYTY